MSGEIRFVQSAIRDWGLDPDTQGAVEKFMTPDLQLDWGGPHLATAAHPDLSWQEMSGLLVCAAICSWRKTMGIYTFDGDLFSALQNSEPPADVPPPPEMATFVFADGRAFLVFNLWDHSNPMDNAPSAFDRLRGDDGFVPPWLAWRCLPEKDRTAVDVPFVLVKSEEMVLITKLFAYLATKAPDIEGPARPRALQRNKRGEVVAQNHPVAWQVGLKIGARIRQQRVEASLGGTVRPHVRRGHFHTYLYGKGKQERSVKWTAPTFVLGGPDRPTIKKVDT